MPLHVAQKTNVAHILQEQWAGNKHVLACDREIYVLWKQSILCHIQ